MTPVVLGAIERRRGAGLAGLRVCLASLFAYAPSIRVVIFNRAVGDADLDALLATYPVGVVNAQEWDAGHEIPTDSPYAAHTLRFAEYDAWLAAHPVAHVICTDLLDVVFQGDPVPLVPETGVVVYEEDHRLGTCLYNLRWLAQTFQPQSYAALLDRPILNCGYLAGSAAAVRRFTARYREILRMERPKRGMDSAVLNVYAYAHLEVRRDAYGVAACRHLGYADPASLGWDGERVVVGGQVPTVVHQYIRHPAIAHEVVTAWT